MFSNWKSAVYEYAHLRNRLELEGDARQLVPYVRDDRFIRRLEQRIRRAQASRRARKAAPVRSETGLKLRSVRDEEQEAVVELELRRKIEYEQQGFAYQEERIERERLTVTKSGKQWQIAEVVPQDGERRTLHDPPPPFVPVAPEDAPPRIRTTPYLNSQILPSIGSDMSQRYKVYDRAKAKSYADKWWNGENPRYLTFEVDCTNFVSQCLFAGGAPMNYTGRRESGWWYRGKEGNRELWSYSWAVANSLQSYLATNRDAGLRAETVHSPDKLEIGDVICYDWEGDGRYQHNTIVTAFDAAGMPLVNAHTVSSYHRYWDYRDSYAWTPNTRYRFFHIPDYF